MNVRRKSQERLSALLAALEEEVMCTETKSTMDVSEIRAQVEALIEQYSNRNPDRTRLTSFPRNLTRRTSENLAALRTRAMMGESSVFSSTSSKVRMAFSGEKSDSSKKSSKQKESSEGGSN